MTFSRGAYSSNPIQHCFYMRGEFGFAQIYRRGNNYFIHWIDKRKTERIKKTNVVELFNSEQRIDDETYLKIKKGIQNETD